VNRTGLRKRRPFRTLVTPRLLGTQEI